MDLSKPYQLEVYEPGSAGDVWLSLAADAPFMSINVGDIVNPGVWEDNETPVMVLRVLNVEHVIWQHDKTTKHKLRVFTEEVENTGELRTRRGA